MVDFVGIRMVVERFKQEGTSHSCRDVLKIQVKMAGQLAGKNFQARRGHTNSLPGFLSQQPHPLCRSLVQVGDQTGGVRAGGSCFV